ncbi:MAG: hypothetical protein AAGI38_14070 [Bacteroidota bacterium]
MKFTTLNRNNILSELTANSLAANWRRKQQRESAPTRPVNKGQKEG